MPSDLKKLHSGWNQGLSLISRMLIWCLIRQPEICSVQVVTESDLTRMASNE